MQKIFLKITDYLDPAEISRNLENKDIEGILHDVEDTCINYDTPNDIDGAWPRADKTIAAGVTEDDFIFGWERPKEIVAFARNLLPQAHKDAKMCIASAMVDDPGLANARYLGTNVDVESVLKNVADCILADGLPGNSPVLSESSTTSRPTGTAALSMTSTETGRGFWMMKNSKKFSNIRMIMPLFLCCSIKSRGKIYGFQKIDRPRTVSGIPRVPET